jgi:lipopolysaccharide biosynthesis regulator YciM
MTLTSFFIITGLILLLILLIIVNILIGRKKKGNVDLKSKEIDYYIQKGDYKTAELYLLDLINKNTDNYEYFLELAHIYRLMNKYHKALDIHNFLTKRVSLNNKTLIIIHTELIQDYIYINDFENAISAINDVRNSFNLSKTDNKIIDRMEIICMENTEKYDIAINIAKKVFSKHNYSDYLAYIGSKSILSGNQKIGEKFINKAYKIDNKGLLSSLYKAELMVKKGKIEEPVKLFGKILNKNSDLSYMIINYLKEHFGQPEQSEDYENFLLQISKLTKGNEILLQELEDIYIKKGDYEKTMAIIEKILESNPKNLKSHINKLYIYASTNQDSLLLDEISNLNGIVSAIEGKFTCRTCNRKFDTYHLRCPNCKDFKTLGIL